MPVEFDQYPGYEYGYSYPVFKSITKYDSSAEELKDYWLTFKAEFERSYKEITKPYIVERAVPIPVPGKHRIVTENGDLNQLKFFSFCFSAHQSCSNSLHKATNPKDHLSQNQIFQALQTYLGESAVVSKLKSTKPNNNFDLLILKITSSDKILVTQKL